MSVLDALGEAARERVAAARRALPEEALRQQVAAMSPPRAVLSALGRAGRPALVAEFKRASPSAGAIAADADPARTARVYEEAGAAMVSVLTEPARFRGCLEDLRRVRAAVSLPVLQKDFVVDAYQLWEARAWGADCVLLIVALVGDALPDLLGRAEAIGLTALVEAHSEAELSRALASGARLVGVNNRDLATLAVDTGLSERLLPSVPPDRLALAESGLASPGAVARAVRAGADGVLVGEYLMRSAHPGAAARGLRRGGQRFVKIDGITRREDALAAEAAGADAVGFVFADSPRRLTPAAARQLGEGLGVERVGVFADAPPPEVAAIARAAGLTMVQLHDRDVAPTAVTALRGEGFEVLAVVDASAADAPMRARALAGAGALPLLDARTGPRPDGQGGRLDLEAAAKVARAVRRLVIAGGLDAQSVGRAIERVDPYGVDVSSGVESSPGIKDPGRMRAFVAAARARAPARLTWG